MGRAEFLLKFVAIFILGTITIMIDLWYHGTSILMLFQHWFPFTWIAFGSAGIAAITD